jgi:hypothetical protein
MAHEFTSLPIFGCQELSVPNTFIRQSNDSQHLALVLPGMRYTVSAPALYYATSLLLEHEADVLLVEYEYFRQPDFQTVSGEERLQWISADVAAAYQAAISQRTYTRLTLIGKSLGTLAMGHLLSTAALPERVDAIWLTPLLRVEYVRQQILNCGHHSLLVIGTADPHYDAECLDEIQQSTGHEVLTIDGADHTFDLKDGVIPTIKVLEKLITDLEQFLAKG